MKTAVQLRQGSLALETTLQCVGSAIAIAERDPVMKSLMTHRVTSVTPEAHARVAKRQIGNRRLTMIVAALEAIDLLTLQLVLDALAVWRVADEGENGPDTLDEECTLSRIRIVQSSLEKMPMRRCAYEKEP